MSDTVSRLLAEGFDLDRAVEVLAEAEEEAGRERARVYRARVIADARRRPGQF